MVGLVCKGVTFGHHVPMVGLVFKDVRLESLTYFRGAAQ
jgi:hypothetical protein